MPNQRPPSRPKSTEEILREMESMTKDAESSAHVRGSAKQGGGAIKSLLDFFVKIESDETSNTDDVSSQTSGSRQAGPATGTAPRSQRVSDLVAGEPAPRFSAPQPKESNLAGKPFDEIYREAGVADSPCTADDLARLMENPTVANQPLSVKVVAVNLTLSAKGIGIDAPISDAVRRDRALDAYQRMMTEHANATEQQNTAKIQKITQETEEYLKRKQVEMEALRSEIADAKRESLDFSQRRQAEEKRLADLISPFLEGKPNPVTIGDQGIEQKPQ